MKLEKIRERLDFLNAELMRILLERWMLVKEVAFQKKEKGAVIQAPAREAAIFDEVADRCRVFGLDPNYVLEIMALIIAHAKDAECDIMGVETFLDKNPRPDDELRKNLLDLTAATAAGYVSQYCDGVGSNVVQRHLFKEHRQIIEIIGSLPNKGFALDLGCAVGNISELIEGKFEQVVGIDVSPHMIEQAQKRRQWPDSVQFRIGDIDTGIPAKDSSVSFVIANLGAASEVSRDLLPEIARVLESGGKAFLSFANAAAISNLWYYPWPSTLRAHLNPYNNTLEVWYQDKVYVVRSIGTTAQVLEERCKELGLTLEWVETYPTFLAIVPRFFFDSHRFQKLVEAVEKADEVLASKSPYQGTYLTALISKP